MAKMECSDFDLKDLFIFKRLELLEIFDRYKSS